MKEVWNRKVTGELLLDDEIHTQIQRDNTVYIVATVVWLEYMYDARWSYSARSMPFVVL